MEVLTRNSSINPLPRLITGGQRAIVTVFDTFGEHRVAEFFSTRWTFKAYNSPVPWLYSPGDPSRSPISDNWLFPSLLWTALRMPSTEDLTDTIESAVSM